MILYLSDKGLDVKELQQFLVEEGFLPTSTNLIGEYILPESNYGVKTKRAVLRIQEFTGLEETGIWDSDIKILYNVRLKELGYDEIVIPRMLMRDTRADEEKYDTYTVKAGDCLWDIAKALLGDGSRWKEIQKLNNMSSSVITVGQVLKIPESKISSSSGTSSSTTGDTGNYNTIQYRKGVAPPNVEINCFIMNLNTSRKIEFYMAPETLTDTNNATFEDETPRGRSSPFKGYFGSGPREISFTVNLFADYCPDGIVETERWIRALIYPEKNSVIIPPKCLFHLGDFINVTGVPVSVTTEWKKPYKDGIYAFADVSIIINQVDTVSRTASEVEESG